MGAHYKNVKFMCAVVASPEPNFSTESMDSIFSNWLLMYFSDRKVEELVERMVKWQKVSSQDDKGFQKFMDNVQYKWNFDVEVVGIDPYINMVSFALERVIGLKRSVEFESVDCTKKSYPDNAFDAI
ncbi:Phosphoethanolamine N-methyltransferase 3 [Vitis vinifera]|uniref:phosphoethanolamine N-methyltransferase n=1 Tax=Vitis vinifera TaxID=29760 RepID=A0A438BLU3_VITVI|nr:Phosphoethanolamine N-methyltransferase 3 [Vitis vinifera]